MVIKYEGQSLPGTFSTLEGEWAMLHFYHSHRRQAGPLVLLLLSFLSIGQANQNTQTEKENPTFFEKREGAFKQTLTIKPNEQFIFQFPVYPKLCHFYVRPEFDARLEIQVYQDGILMAKDVKGGVKASHLLQWTPSEDGIVQVRIKSTDNLTNICKISFYQGKEGPPPIPGHFIKDVPFKGVSSLPAKESRGLWRSCQGLHLLSPHFR